MMRAYIMDVIANVQMPEQTQSKNHVDANQLSQVFDTYLSKIKVLSLDCFDTILWRKTAAPVDVFHDLEQYPTFQKLGFTAFQRIQAESNARLNNLIVHGTNEATLRDIYLANLPELTETEIKELEAEEIAAEVQACYPFPPIIELMRKAHQHNIKIIIISDSTSSVK